MSRWIEQFESHAFQNSWRNFKDALDRSTVDDETVITSVKELARLKKVVSYVDEIVNGLDPELVPGTIWDNFNTQSAACQQQINAYNSNRDIGHIQKANAHVDNLLSYVRPYMVAAGKAASSLASSVKKYASTIDEYVDSFQGKAKHLLAEIEGYKKDSETLLDEVRKTNGAIGELEAKLFGNEEIVGFDRKIDELVADIDQKHQEISDHHAVTLVGDESIKSIVEKTKDAVLDDKREIEEMLGDVEKEVAELDKFHAKMFGKDSEGGGSTGGLSGELDVRIKVLSDFENEQKTKYKALNDEIESLIPGATSAGLATAYRDMKESFDKPIYYSSLIFYLSIALLVGASTILAIDTVGGENWVTFVKFTEWDVVLRGLVYKLPFYGPILWLAYYATKRRSEYHRLQQEYAHKEALAKSYNSYKKQLEDLDGNDLTMLKGFIMKAIDAIAYNASTTLDGKHGDNMPTQEVLEKLADSLLKSASASAKP